jgi:hypothetical protein
LSSTFGCFSHCHKVGIHQREELVSAFEVLNIDVVKDTGNFADWDCVVATQDNDKSLPKFNLLREKMVPEGGFEPPTRGFSIRCSTN